MAGFACLDKTYDLFDHPYNTTLLNERSVEIPLALEFIESELNKNSDRSRGLEVGNVLSHYGHIGHNVVDKYEKASGVENIDVLDVEGQFQWIVAISTLEHVGWDEKPFDAGKSVEALKHLRDRCDRMFVTAPMSWNPAFDIFLTEQIFDTPYRPTASVTMVRDDNGLWTQSLTRQRLRYIGGGRGGDSVYVGWWL